MIILKIVNLIKKFNQVTAINNINLEIEKGKIVGLIGPDGAGKTTLLRLLAGLLKPDSGLINFKEINVTKKPAEIKEKIGYMPQYFSLYGDLTVLENLKFFGDLYKIKKEKFELKIEKLLNFSGLTSFGNTLARNLSGGMQKKLALACNLFHTPEILLLDEPTTGVDPISRKELWKIFYEIKSQGITIILTTPYMDEALKCDFVGFLYNGEILDYGTPSDLINQIKEIVAEVYIENNDTQEILEKLPNLKNIYRFGNAFHLIFDTEKIDIEEIKDKFKIQKIRKINPSFEDVFFLLLQKRSEN